MRKQVTVESPGMRRLLAALAQAPMTDMELAQACHLSPRTLRSSGYLRTLHTGGQIHIGSYRPTTTNPSPVWTLGSGPDAPRPRKLTNAEKCRSYKERHGLLRPPRLEQLLRPILQRDFLLAWALRA